jgi:hypothetical protein
MTVKIRRYAKRKQVGLEADIRFRWPDGTWFRRRFRAPVNTENQAQRWAEDLERRVYADGKGSALARSARAPLVVAAPEEGEVRTTRAPKLDEFWPRFISGHCAANRHKPSSIARKESAYSTWLKPRLGHKRIDAIQAADIAALKGDLAKLSARSANNVLDRKDCVSPKVSPSSNGCHESASYRSTRTTSRSGTRSTTSSASSRRRRGSTYARTC